MPRPIRVDTIISAKWIIPIEPIGQVFQDCSLIVDQGLIVAIVPTEGVHQQYLSDSQFHLNQHVLMPGFVNAHGHAAMSLLRGYADDTPLHTWLTEHIWPAESHWVSDDFVRDGTELAIAEMLKTGTTCFSDMYFYPEAAAKVCHASGIRAQITFPVLDFPTAWASNADEYIHKGLQLHDDYRSHDRIRIGFGPHAPYTVSDEPLQRVAMLANELQAPIHIHVHETAFEVEQAVKDRGQRPLQRLFDLGVLNPLTQCLRCQRHSLPRVQP
jgi:5-methylthioadenosine/S-adenosylhomocysteine deaminase